MQASTISTERIQNLKYKRRMGNVRLFVFNPLLDAVKIFHILH